MKVRFAVSAGARLPEPGGLHRMVIEAERLGFDTLWFSDLTVVPSTSAVYRGGRVVADVAIGHPAAYRTLLAGIECTVAYSQEMTSGNGESADNSRATVTETAFERWVDLDASRSGPHRLELDVPPDAPFTYSGRAIGFEWTLAVREKRAAGRDSVAATEIHVLP